MRVLMTTTGYAGHTLPMIPFARALRDAGHEVLIAGPRSRRAIVEGFALPYHGVDEVPEKDVWAVGVAAYDLPYDVANTLIISEIFGRLATRAALPGILALAKSWRPHLIIRESYEFAGSLAAQANRIPEARVAAGLRSTDSWIMSSAAANVERVRKELGLGSEAWRTRPSPCFTLTPEPFEDLCRPGPDDVSRFRAPQAHIEQALPNWWPRAEGPLVYVSFGTVAAGLPFFPTLYRAAVDALADVPVRVLMTLGTVRDAARVGPLPQNVHVERWVSQAEVMRHAAVMFGNAGYGSTLCCFLYGVPMVVIPLFGDQKRNAARIVNSGAGVILSEFASLREAVEEAPRIVATKLADAIYRVLGDPRHRLAAAEMAAAIASLPPVDAAVTALQLCAAATGDCETRSMARDQEQQLV